MKQKFRALTVRINKSAIGVYGDMSWTFLPASRVRRYISLTIALILTFPIFFYLALLSFQTYSYFQAKYALETFESLELGVSRQEYLEKVQGMDCDDVEGTLRCTLLAGAVRSETLVRYLGKLPRDWGHTIFLVLPKLGLSPWMLTSGAKFEQNRLTSIELTLFLTGRDQTLGARWRMARELPPDELRVQRLPNTTPTLMYWFHITSMPSGEGYSVLLTPRSTPEEIAARTISRRCLRPSFSPCEGLCELLPDAASLLKSRRSDFGGCTSAPAAACEPGDSCKQFRGGLYQ